MTTTARIPASRGDGDRGSVVARRDRDHARRLLRGVEQREPEDRAADLERAGCLEMLRLGVERPAGEADAARRLHDAGRRP